VILTTQIYAAGIRIDYAFNTKTDVHSVHFVGGDRRGVRGSAPQALMALVPYRAENSDVRELIAWLAR